MKQIGALFRRRGASGIGHTDVDVCYTWMTSFVSVSATSATRVSSNPQTGRDSVLVKI